MSCSIRLMQDRRALQSAGALRRWGQLRRAVAVGDAVAQRVAGLRRQRQPYHQHITNNLRNYIGTSATFRVEY
jgi:lipase chaperone LimK